MLSQVISGCKSALNLRLLLFGFSCTQRAVVCCILAPTHLVQFPSDRFTSGSVTATIRQGCTLPPVGAQVAAVNTRRIIGFGVHAGNVDGPTICRMFNQATSGQDWPKYLSSDNDSLFQYHRWKANLRVLDIEEIKSVPHAPMSHPFVERLIGSIRRELLDQTFFWTGTDLESKLHNYQCYYNENRTHSGRDGGTPVETPGSKVVDINKYGWEKHCRGLFELPIAA